MKLDGADAGWFKKNMQDPEFRRLYRQEMAEETLLAMAQAGFA